MTPSCGWQHPKGIALTEMALIGRIRNLRCNPGLQSALSFAQKIDYEGGRVQGFHLALPPLDNSIMEMNIKVKLLERFNT